MRFSHKTSRRYFAAEDDKTLPKFLLLLSYYWTILTKFQCVTFSAPFGPKLAVAKMLRQQKIVKFSNL
jgi:hypothetical protein